MEDDDFISKTRLKRQMRDLQDVGAALVKLNAEQLARLELPERLREAVMECRKYTKHEAIRRQMQYIGKIMRDVDAGPIAEQIARMEAPGKRQAALFHVAERWRKELLADTQAMTRFVAEYPAADPQRLRKLVAAAREEQGTSKPPKQYRELFHVLNALIQDQGKINP